MIHHTSSTNCVPTVLHTSYILRQSTYYLPTTYYNMRASLLQLFGLLAHTITTSAAPISVTPENLAQILSDLVIPQEQHNSTIATKTAVPNESAAAGIVKVLVDSVNSSKWSNGTNTTADASTVTIASETNVNQLQISRRRLLGRRFRASNGPAIRVVPK